MVNRWGVGSLGLIANWPGAQLNNIVVLASDYDALAASVEYYKDLASRWQAEAGADLARIAALEGKVNEAQDAAVTLSLKLGRAEAALRDMVDRWEPDGGSDKRMWNRARELLGYESETKGDVGA